MIGKFIRRLIIFLIAPSMLMGCISQVTTVRTTPSGFLSASTPKPSLTATHLPPPTRTAILASTPCLGFIATPVSTPLPWSYATDYWDMIAISRISIQGVECAAPQEVARELMLKWLETIKINSPKLNCGLEDYTLDKISIKENSITPQYDIVAGVDYHVKPGRFGDCGWISDRGILEKDGWIKTSDIFGVYRENSYFRLRVLPGWGT